MLSLYVDTAVREDAAPLLELGIFRGLTTNPLLLQRAGLSAEDLPDLVSWVLEQGVEEVFCQAWGDTARDLVACGEPQISGTPAGHLSTCRSQWGSSQSRV